LQTDTPGNLLNCKSKISPRICGFAIRGQKRKICGLKRKICGLIRKICMPFLVLNREVFPKVPDPVKIYLMDMNK
jgi:hypothetical protein